VPQFENVPSDLELPWMMALSDRAMALRASRDSRYPPSGASEWGIYLPISVGTEKKPLFVPPNVETAPFKSGLPWARFADMRKSDLTCPECKAGYRRIELTSKTGAVGEFRCLVCNHVLEVFDGSTEVAIRLTVQPERIFD
jgi:hypothetical protein